MAKRTDEIKVGVLVLVATIILTVTLVLVARGQLFGRGQVTYHAKFKFAGGVEPGTVVRLAGIKAGRVSDVTLDPEDSSKVRVTLELNPNLPLRTDSMAMIQTLGFLGDNYVEIAPGQATTTLAPGGQIPSREIIQMSEVFARVDQVAQDSQRLMANLNTSIERIAGRTDTLMGNVNDVFSTSNKRELNHLLRNGNQLAQRADGLIEQTEPRLQATLTNVEHASEKVIRLLDDFKASTARLDSLVLNLNNTIGELSPELRRDLLAMQTTMSDAQALIQQLEDALQQNRSDIDEIVINFARSARNMEELTNTLKQRPYSMLGLRPVKDRKVPGGK